MAIDTNDSHSDPDPTGMRVALRLAKHSDRALLPPGGRSGRGERERPVPIGQRREWAGPKEEPPTPFRFTMDHRADRLAMVSFLLSKEGDRFRFVIRNVLIRMRRGSSEESYHR